MPSNAATLFACIHTAVMMTASEQYTVHQQGCECVSTHTHTHAMLLPIHLQWVFFSLISHLPIVFVLIILLSSHRSPVKTLSRSLFSKGVSTEAHLQTQVKSIHMYTRYSPLLGCILAAETGLSAVRYAVCSSFIVSFSFYHTWTIPRLCPLQFHLRPSPLTMLLSFTALSGKYLSF